MIIKVISTQNPGNYYIQNTKNLNKKELKKHLEYLKRNKKANLLDYQIICYFPKTEFIKEE